MQPINMNYREYTFKLSNCEDFHKDLLINSLAEIGFDTFEDLDGGFKGYISEPIINEQRIIDIAGTYADMFTFSFESKIIPHQNWNEIWESNFEPLNIQDHCYIRATFHEPHPEFEYEIIVDPKMAFGTGHHPTTALMIELMLQINFAGKKVLDMGCGTGILAILAAKMGAQEVLAIDYDPICFESTIENTILNRVNNIHPLCGSKEVIPDTQYDVILANINRNILLDQIHRYSEVLAPNGIILFSGFYQIPDLEIIRNKSSEYCLKYIKHKTQNNWVAAYFKLKR